jgi:hypothetical protein
VYDEAEWAPLCGEVKQATHLPVGYVGRVTRLASAERILAAGQADLVGLARALIADPELIVKSAAGHAADVRPCIALQECIDRRVVENLPFSCGVNPRAGRADDPPAPTVAQPLSVLVVGGGPAGTEFAAQMAERGHRVTLWERESALGGQLVAAAALRMNANYARWTDWQSRRLPVLGVDVHLDRTADPDAVLTAAPDELYLDLKDRHPRVHRLGDAFAPRRVVFATRQAYELARTFDRT